MLALNSSAISSGGRVPTQVWTLAGCLPLTAKVADFGLALPLGPQDTHATMLARVRVAG